MFTLNMPKLSPTMEKGTVAKWHKNLGEYVAEGDPLVDIATDKSVVEYAAEASGWLKKQVVKEGEQAPVQGKIAVFSKTQEGLAQEEPEAPEAPPNDKPMEKQERPPVSTNIKPNIKATPLAKKLAQERGISLEALHGSGPAGRIVAADIDRIKQTTTVHHHSNSTTLSPFRQAMNNYLTESKKNIPHFYLSQEVDARPLVALREACKERLPISYNDWIIRAIALALQAHPKINSGYDQANDKIISFPKINIAVAVEVPEGILTPVILEADQKPLPIIAKELAHLIKKTREGKITPAELEGGSFTVSSLGSLGIRRFSAIVCPPQAAILAVGAIVAAPIVDQGRVVPGFLMELTLSADHRVLDGAPCARFLQTLAHLLTKPALLLL